ACRSFSQSFRHTVEDDRMTLSRVGADEEKRIGQIDIVVTARWAVASKRQRHAAGGAGHAEPAVAVDMVRPQVSPRELAGQILRLGRELARGIEPDRARAVLLKDAIELARHVIDGRLG